MSKTRMISALAAGLVMLAAACWLATGTFPLMAAPQVVNDYPGVTVGLNGATLMHRAPVDYPAEARRLGIQGTLSVEVKVDGKGNVADARVLSGPDELRKAALESVLKWHFTTGSAGTTRVVQITFELPQAGAAPEQLPAVRESITVTARGGAVGGVVGGVPGGARGGVLGGIIGSVPAGAPPPPPPPTGPRTFGRITFSGLSEQAQNDLLSRLNVRQGDTFSNEGVQNISKTARDFDEHLTLRWANVGNEITLQIAAPDAPLPPRITASDAAPPGRIKVGPNVQAAMVIRKVAPMYPELAKNARVQGVVHLAAIIAKDGTIQELHSLGGPALLIQSAMDAVKQWVYRPTLLNGQPVEVETTIDVNFALEQ